MSKGQKSNKETKKVAGHDGKREKGREESEEERKGTHRRMIRPDLR